MRKTHLQHTTKGGPACKNGRTGGALSGEHITVRYAEFVTATGQCERCKTGTLFAFLARKAAQ